MATPITHQPTPENTHAPKHSSANPLPLSSGEMDSPEDPSSQRSQPQKSTSTAAAAAAAAAEAEKHLMARVSRDCIV